MNARHRLPATYPAAARSLPIRSSAWTATLVAAMLLAACGGGGGDDPAADDAQPGAEEMQAVAASEAAAQWQALEGKDPDMAAVETTDVVVDPADDASPAVESGDGNAAAEPDTQSGAAPSGAPAAAERETAQAAARSARRSATSYAATGGGNCQYAKVSRPNGKLLVAALNDWDISPLGGKPNEGQMCGAYIDVKGAAGSVRLLVTDRCPHNGNPKCLQGHLDLSPDAFRAVAGDLRIGYLRSWDSDPKRRITWSYAVGSNPRVSYRSMPGSNPYWIGIQVLNLNRPLRSLQIDPSGQNRWVALKRDANVFALQCSSHFRGLQGRCPATVHVRLTSMSGASQSEWVALPQRSATVAGKIKL